MENCFFFLGGWCFGGGPPTACARSHFVFEHCWGSQRLHNFITTDGNSSLRVPLLRFIRFHPLPPQNFSLRNIISL